MSWSFDDSLSTDRDRIRLRIGDTDTNDQLLSNETVDALLLTRTSVILAAIDCVQAIIAKLAREIDRSNIGMSGSRSQKTTHFHSVLRELQKEAQMDTGMKVGGISRDDRNTIEDDSDFIKPSFTVGITDRTGRPRGEDEWDDVG